MPGFAEHGTGEFKFAVGSVSGLRQWTLNTPDFSLDPHQADRHWDRVLLAGATGYSWPPGTVEATCNNGRSHPVPAEFAEPGSNSRCGCGTWAYWDMQGLSASRFATGKGLPVLGVIEGYGRVLLGPRGFRSQKARITALAPAFVIQSEVTPPQERFWRYDEQSGARMPEFEAEEVQRRAQQHADAWMAVIQDRLGQLYPGARVFATARGLLASVKTEGRPERRE
jgi:hypothetical protein